MAHASMQSTSNPTTPELDIQALLTLDSQQTIVTTNNTAQLWFPDLVPGQTRLCETWLAGLNLQLIDRNARPVSIEALLQGKLKDPYLGLAFGNGTRWVQWHLLSGSPDKTLVLIDVTTLMNDMIQLQEANNEAAIRDLATGLYNRRYAMERLDQLYLHAKRYQTHFTIALVDIDHFKRINDTYGHTIGDRIIEGLSVVLGRGLRQTDICARYGGEEFLVLMPETETQEAIMSIDRLRQQISEMKWPQIKRPVTISAGIIAWQPNKSIEQLMFLADQRLSTAKKAGRNQVCGDLV